MKTSLLTSFIHYPFRYDFEQAVFILTTQFNQYSFSTHTQKSSSQEDNHVFRHLDQLSIKSHISLAQYPSPVYKVDLTQQKPILWINFFGLAGLSGPLPEAYTDFILERLRLKDTAFCDFLDVFHHRLSSLWYKISYTYKPCLQSLSIAHAPTEIEQVIASFCGLQKMNTFFEHFMIQYPQLFSRNQNNTTMIERFLTHYFGFSIQITPHKGRFHLIHEEDQTLIGLQKGRWNYLGKTSVLGRRIWKQNSDTVIEVGPLNAKIFYEFHKKSGAPQSFPYQFETLCKRLLYKHRHFYFRYFLDKKHRKMLCLKASALHRLGIDTWVVSKDLTS